jgi:hypothetical protein
MKSHFTFRVKALEITLLVGFVLIVVASILAFGAMVPQSVNAASRATTQISFACDRGVTAEADVTINPTQTRGTISCGSGKRSVDVEKFASSDASSTITIHEPGSPDQVCGEFFFASLPISFRCEFPAGNGVTLRIQ